jgi:ubiquinone biosynthesis protein
MPQVMVPSSNTHPEAARRPSLMRPLVRPRERASSWGFMRRASVVWWSMVRLSVFTTASRFRGGDRLAREIRSARLLRRELERLGGVFVKVGQLLSVRTDQYPWEVCQEFRKLLDHVVPFPGEVAERLISEELKAPLAAIFARFDRQPIAAASIGQVHVGWLAADGSKVAIKVQRPGIAEQVRVDLSLMRMFARVVDGFNVYSGQRLMPVIDELERVMDEELSYIGEARATDQFRRSLKGRKHIYAPKVHFEHTTDRVLTMEFIEGLAASVLLKAIENNDEEALARFERLGIRRKKLARRFYRAILEQIYEHDICHTDPHPGNLIIMPGNKVCFIDFGAVGYFGPTFRARIERVTVAFASHDADAVADATLASWEPLPLRDVDRFKAELKPLYQRMINNAGSKHGDPRLKSNGRIFVESARIAAKYGIQAPWDHLRFTRLLWEFDTTVVALNPEFNFQKAMRAYFEAKMARKVKDNLSRPQLKKFFAGLVNVAATMPQDLAEIRYQAFTLLRRSDHLYVRSMSKMSYVGVILLQYATLALFAAGVALAWYRYTYGAEATDAQLAAQLPFALPWWVWGLLLFPLLFTMQRIRLRVTDID